MNARPTGPLHVDPACVELRGLALGLRRAWRLRLSEQQAGGFAEQVRGAGHAVALSADRYGEVPGGFLGRADDGVRLAVVAVDPATAHACLADEERSAGRAHDSAEDVVRTLQVHRRLGRAYGYPSCCVEAFCDGHVEHMLGLAPGLSHNALLIARAAARTAAFDLLLAALGDRLGARSPSPLRHLPCRFDCAASVRLAGALLADLRTSNPPLHRRYVALEAARFRVEVGGEVARIDGGSSTPGDGAPATSAGATGTAVDRPASRFPLLLSFTTGR